MPVLIFLYMKILLGSRKSDLAQIQSRLVADKLKKFKSGIDVDFVFKDVAVDLNLDTSLVNSEDKGLFTKDLSLDLIAENIDAVVHSWKDLPVLGPKETRVIATLEREDPRDVVFVKKTSITKAQLCFLSSSPRREENLGKFVKEFVFPQAQISFVPVRGNLPTRMKKFLGSDGDALVLALAAVKRLLKHGNFESKEALKQVLSVSKVLVVPVSKNPPAPAQGALAIEIKRDRRDLAELFGKINHKTTFNDVHAERQRLNDFGGGCHLKLGIYQHTTERGTLMIERGLSPDGSTLNKTTWSPAQPLPCVPKEAFFDASNLNLFDRKPVAAEKPLGDGIFYNISKTEALPDGFVQENDVLWVAGLETWKKLREKGLWITGTHDSFGESFMPLPLILWPEHKLVKLSHTQAPAKEGALLATYELVRNQNLIPPLAAYELFFWPSGSVFLECLKAEPSLADKQHVCGLGNSYEEIIKHVPAERVYSVLKREDCLPQT